MKPFIVMSDGFDKELFEEFRKDDQFEVYPEKKITQEKLQELLPKINGLVIRSATKATKELVDKAPNLKYVIRAGAGTDNIDKKYCQEKGIKVSNTPGANNNSAAEHAIALMLTVLRKTSWADTKMKNGGWDKSLFVGNELSNKTVGIVGFGQIGQIVAKRLSGFEPKVLFFDPIVKDCDMAYATKVNDLKAIFATADIISLHLPFMEATKGLITRELLSSMKPDAIIINAARGKIVDEEAIHELLSSGKIKAAGFDVFATEPLEENSPLRNLENIVLTPHLGASTEEAQVRVGEMAVHQLKEFFLKDNLLNEVRA